MGLYEHLPYANFHELNLDKILEIVNKIPSMVREEVITALANFPIPDGSITTAKLADYAVASAKIASSGVTASKIASSAVTAAKIASSAVTEAKIAPGAVTTSKLADAAITYQKLAADMGTVITGTSPGNVSVSTGVSTFTELASLEIPETGTYILMPWIMAYGVANSAAGYIDVNVSGTSGHTSGYGYGARWIHNVPAYTDATASAFNWCYPRTLNAGDKVYLNVAHNTGATRNIRGNVRALRIK